MLPAPPESPTHAARIPRRIPIVFGVVVAALPAHDSPGQVHDRWPTELSRRGYSLHHIHDPNPEEGTDYSPPAPRTAPPTPPAEPQVLLLGGRGMLGPHVQSELEDEGYHLRVTDFVAERSAR